MFGYVNKRWDFLIFFFTSHSTKCRFWETTTFCGLSDGHFTCLHGLRVGGEIIRQVPMGATEFNAPRPRRQNALALAFADGAPFVFRNEREKLKDDFRDEVTDQPPRLVRRIQQRHVQDFDVRLLLTHDHSPFIKHFRVIASQSVKGLDDENVPRVQPTLHPLPGGTVEVLAAAPVDENVL